MEKPNRKMSKKHADKSQTTEIKSLIEWPDQDKSYGESYLFEFLKQGDLNLIFGSNTDFKRIFGFWFGIKNASKVDAIYHFSLIKPDTLISYFKHAQIPGNLYKGYIQEKQEEASKTITDFVKSKIKESDRNVILVIDSINGMGRIASRERQATTIISAMKELTDDLKPKQISLTTIILADIKLPSAWESIRFNHLNLPAQTKEVVKNFFYFGSSARDKQHYYIKPLKRKILRDKILLFELMTEFGNHHFKMKAWDYEKLHLALSPQTRDDVAVFLIGLICLATIREEYWEGICKGSSKPDFIIAIVQQNYVIHILEKIYEFKTIIPLAHITYIISDTNITVKRFDEIASTYFHSKGRKYDLQPEGRNIQ